MLVAHVIIYIILRVPGYIKSGSLLMFSITEVDYMMFFETGKGNSPTAFYLFHKKIPVKVVGQPERSFTGYNVFRDNFSKITALQSAKVKSLLRLYSFPENKFVQTNF